MGCVSCNCCHGVSKIYCGKWSAHSKSVVKLCGCTATPSDMLWKVLADEHACWILLHCIAALQFFSKDDQCNVLLIHQNRDWIGLPAIAWLCMACMCQGVLFTSMWHEPCMGNYCEVVAVWHTALTPPRSSQSLLCEDLKIRLHYDVTLALPTGLSCRHLPQEFVPWWSHFLGPAEMQLL